MLAVSALVYSPPTRVAGTPVSELATSLAKILAPVTVEVTAAS